MDLPPLSTFSSLVFLSQWSTISAHPLAYVLFFCFIFCIIHLLRHPSSKSKQLRREPPKVPGAWPLLGHIDLLALPLDKFTAMADTYGPIYSIRLGTREAVVINDREMVKECFTTNDKLISNRPVTFETKYGFNNDYSVNHLPYGSSWRDFRRVAAVALFSHLRLEMQRHIRTSEINLWFNHLYMLWKKKITSGGVTAPAAVSVEVNSWIRDVFFFVIFDIIIGADDDHDQQQNGGLSIKATGKKYKKVLDEAVHLMDVTFAISDFIPFLTWYDILSGKITAMEKKAKEMDSFQDMWLQEYRRRRHVSHKSSIVVDNNISDDQDQDDQVKPYMDSLLSTIHQNPQFDGVDADVVIKAACQDMIIAGYSTVRIALPWALFFLMNNRHVLNKAQKELDENIGKERQVEESDIKQLPYLQAILKETLRLYVPGSDVLSRVASEDCEVGGFHIKAGTKIIINLRKIHRDPSDWPEPLEFKPERFLSGSSNEGLDVKGRNFEFIPFGSGRRMCPAVTFALRLMHLVLARLIHGFELNISRDDGTADMSISLIERIAHLQLLISPRLASEAYAVKH